MATRSNLKIFRDGNFNSLNISNQLTVNDSKVSSPNTNFTSSRIYNDGTYDNVQISGIFNLLDANITEPATNQQWDGYRQSATNISNAQYQQSLTQNVNWESNSDESEVPQFIGNFTKGLMHNSSGRVANPNHYIQLRDSLLNRNVESLSSVPLSGSRKYVQPLASFATNMIGPVGSSVPLPAAPSLSSSQTAAEMVEDYCHVLCRDIPFNNYSTNSTIADCVTYMNALSNYQGPKPVTPSNIFRGVGEGVSTGPYLSQIFFMSNRLWPFTINSQINYPTRTSANNRMITESNYLDVQNGDVPESGPAISGTATYPATGRDLTYNVWKDSLGEWFVLAPLRLVEAGAPFSSLNPYNNPPLNNNQHGFVTWSLNDLMICIFSVAQNCLTSAWYGKWVVNRRTRPEGCGNEVEQYRKTTTNPANLHSDLLTSGVLNDIFSLQSNHYLAQTYPEGSPMHPAYPAGHAVFSGACGTVVKAFLDENWIIPSPVEPDSFGTTLNPIGDTLTLGGEINKLIANIAIGRDWAGVHYRSDGYDGIIQGENYAVQFLQNWINRYPEPNSKFQFHGYLGNEITIEQQTNFAQEIVNSAA